jgi:hypothetical protein
MFRGLCVRVSTFLMALFLVLPFRSPLLAQGLRSVVQPIDRVFPSVGAGVSAIKRDSEGRYYILAKPANHIAIYAANGGRLAEIPPPGSPTTLVYAMDFDIGPEGIVYVADRGANAVLIFRSDGMLAARIPVFAPTSVVALSGHQFAVASFHAKRLVQIFDDRGTLVRSFGDPADSAPPPASGDPTAPKQTPVYLGRIYGDPNGQIYFAFASLADPTFRRYDRYGYVAYEASVPEDELVGPETNRFDRFEFSFNFTRFDLSDQIAGSATVGSSGDVRFGGGVGMGVGGGLGRQEGAGRGGGFGGGSGGLGGTSGGGGGMLSAQADISRDSFHVTLGGNTGSGGRGGRFANNPSSSESSPDLTGSVLQFANSGSALTSQNPAAGDVDLAQLESTDILNPSGGAFANADFSSALSASDNSSSPSPSIPGDLGFGLGLGAPGGEFGEHFLYNRFFGGGFGSPGQRPPGAENATGHEFYPGAGASSEPFPHYGPHGHFGTGLTGMSGNVRVNLDKPVRDPNDKPVLTALVVDPETGDVWAAIGDSLVHFGPSGNRLGVFTLVTAGDVPLKPSAILIEHDRVLVAADPWGIFEFARPDSYLAPAIRAASPGGPSSSASRP